MKKRHDYNFLKLAKEKKQFEEGIKFAPLSGKWIVRVPNTRIKGSGSNVNPFMTLGQFSTEELAQEVYKKYKDDGIQKTDTESI